MHSLGCRTSMLAGFDAAGAGDDRKPGVDRGGCTEQSDEGPFNRRERGDAAPKEEPPDRRQRG